MLYDVDLRELEMLSDDRCCRFKGVRISFSIMSSFVFLLWHYQIFHLYDY